MICLQGGHVSYKNQDAEVILLTENAQYLILDNFPTDNVLTTHILGVIIIIRFICV